MAKLGVVSDEQFHKELENSSKSTTINTPVPSSPSNLVPVKPTNGHPIIEAEVVDAPVRGRPKGAVEVPESVRKLIGEEANIAGRASAIELAKAFGISESSVAAYANGATSTASYNKPSDGLLAYINTRKNRLAKKSLHKLSLTLNALTPDKLQDVKARDLAGIAKDMSVIAKNMEPENKTTGDANAPKFIVYAPTFRDERSYETVVVNDNF